MQLVSRLMDHVLQKRGERTTIVVATSGDTGGAAVEAFRAAFAAAASASSLRISESFFWTCSEKMYCAGRCLDMSISGTIGPVVLMPRSDTHIAFSGLLSAAVAAVGS